MKIFEKVTPFSVFIILFSIFGLVFLFQYGVPLDELTQRYIGIINSTFISGTTDVKTLEEHGYFGPIFESLTYLLEQIIYNSDMYYKILLRHFILFFFFVLSVIAFYRICLPVFNSRAVALATTMVYSLNPIVFAHSFYNSKDTFFMCLLVYVFYFTMQFIAKRKYKYLILASVLLGMACTIRISGMFMAIAVVASLILSGNTSGLKLRNIILFGFIAFISYFIFFPYLWLHPRESLQNLIHYSANNPWPWNTLAAGQEIIAGDLPWWYLFVWMSVGIPVLVLMVSMIGTLFSIKKVNYREPFWMITTILFVLPILYFVLGRPTIYNGWRHMQFLHIPVSLFCGYGLLAMGKKLEKIATLLLGTYSIFVLCIWQPYGYAYFNEGYSVFGKPNTFDQDYWGLSALPALKHISNQNSGQIKIWCNTESAEQNALLLPHAKRNQLEFVKTSNDADYLIWMQRNGLHVDSKQNIIYSLKPAKDTLVWVVKKN
ncbi:MAG: glycosyltransferase family 39 protein [Bacteroidetes bacterium]|nr:glycosyltransferase family 39 protein [Bacteroidota bacterium]